MSNNDVVTFVTKVEFDSESLFVKNILAVLHAYDFSVSENKVKYCGYSASVEAQDIKMALCEAGVPAHEFIIHLDYTRKWGVL